MACPARRPSGVAHNGAMIRKIRLVLCIGVLFLLQATVVHRFSYRSLQPVLRKAAAPLAHLHLAGEAGFPAVCGKSLLQPKGEER